MNNVIIQPLGIQNAPDVLREKAWAGSDHSFGYHGIWAFCGPQGSGKTLLMMSTLRSIHEEYPEALIISDISIFGIPSIPYQGIEDFDNYDNGTKGIIFVLDELQTFFSSIESKNMPASQLVIWSQNRKNRRLILGTSQRFNRIAKPLREQVTWLYQCSRSIFGFLYHFDLCDGSLIDDDGKFNGSNDEKKRHWYCPAVKTMRSYSTLQQVSGDKYMKKGGDV